METWNTGDFQESLSQPTGRVDSTIHNKCIFKQDDVDEGYKMFGLTDCLSWTWTLNQHGREDEKFQNMMLKCI